jgi:hypothetical protein
MKLEKYQRGGGVSVGDAAAAASCCARRRRWRKAMAGNRRRAARARRSALGALHQAASDVSAYGTSGMALASRRWRKAIIGESGGVGIERILLWRKSSQWPLSASK